MTTTARFRNRSAALLWGFAACWLTGLVAMSGVFLRDGAPEGYSDALVGAVLLAFWLAGIALVALTLSKACFSVAVDGAGRTHVVRRYPHRVERRVYRREQLRPAQVVEEKDSDGDPYYFARVETSDGALIDLTEGHRRPRCESACARFNARVFG